MKSNSVRSLVLSEKHSLSLFDGALEDILEELSQHEVFPNQDKIVITAIHIGGLMQLENEDYREALESSDLVYADGISVELLAKIGGFRRIKRAPTTDLGIPMINLLQGSLKNRRLRVALIGGETDLANRAAHQLSRLTGCKIVYETHGFHQQDQWAGILSELSEAKPDLVFVGLGSPYESLFIKSWYSELPNAVYVTCGGWFGFLAGEEARASKSMRKLGLEWAHRLILNPQRLHSRYRKGAVLLAGLSASIFVRRLRNWMSNR